MKNIVFNMNSGKQSQIPPSKWPLFFIFDVLRMTKGLLLGLWTGSVDDQFRRSMIRLFCITRGYGLDFFSFLVTTVRRRNRFPLQSHVLGTFSQDQIESINAELLLKGHSLFPVRLSNALCDELVQFALNTPGLRRPTDQESQAGISGYVESIYDRKNPDCIRFDFTNSTLLAHPIVQKLACDPVLLKTAESYVGPSPVLDIVTMWWSAPSDQPDDQAAQMYHYDMDNLKWIKFFFYLTDVGPKNGPHVFIEGTHRSNGLPQAFREDLYVRFPDELVESHFPPDKRIMFTGPRGTILAEDTRGLHKGFQVLEGDRLLFQLQFSAAQLLTTDKSIKVDRKNCIPEFLDSIQKYPQVFRNISLT